MTTQNACNQTEVGLQANNGSGSFLGRTLTAGSSKINILNGNGASGDPTIDVDQSNIDINGLSGTPLSASGGGTGVNSPTQNSILVANGPSSMSQLTLDNGQVLIGSTGASPAASTLTAGAGISITNEANSITIANTSAGFTWNNVTGTSQAMEVENGYLSNNAALVTLTLPTTADQFSRIRVVGLGAGGWLVAQNAGQTIHFDSVSTTVGTGGSLASVNQYDVIELLCVVENTTWSVVSSVGNITIV